MSNGTSRIRGSTGTDPQGISGPAPAAPPRRPAVPPRAMPGNIAAAVAAAARHRESLMRIPGVIDVRAGYKFTGGRITKTAAVVVAVDRKRGNIPANQGIPAKLDGIPTDLENADPFQRLAATGGPEASSVERPALLIDEIQNSQVEAIAVEEAREIGYKPPRNVRLDAVTGAMRITCHASPDAGWATLGPFLAGAKESITLGMYDFTAPHIYQTARSLLRDNDVTWRQTIDPKESLPGPDEVDSTKAGDLHEKSIINGLKRVAKTRFTSEFARIGSGGTFASAYHIKVAVRDHAAFWLSSGNWQSSNQPDIDFLDDSADRQLISRYNREWHVVVERAPDLAKCFEKFLEYDFKTAAATPTSEAAPIPGPDLLVPVDEILELERKGKFQVFKPMELTFTKSEPVTVQPLLTPDNYADHVLRLLEQRPKKRLYFQNQSLNPIASPTAKFDRMMQLLAEYSNDEKLDVRLIFRNIGPIRKKLESLQLAGFNMARVRMQAGCHTKGIIVDTRTVLLGSHNFTNQGVQLNRDASLLIENEEIAKYFQAIFLHDWDRLARETIREEAVPIPLSAAEAAAVQGSEMTRVPWSYYEEE